MYKSFATSAIANLENTKPNNYRGKQSFVSEKKLQKDVIDR